MNTIRFIDPNLTSGDFINYSLEVFRYQAQFNKVYREYIKGISCDISKVNKLEDIPFLPIEFFKTHSVITGDIEPELHFLSSGTGGVRSRHYISDKNLYHESIRIGFEYFFGPVENYHILALLPSYMEQKNSSLIHMVKHLMTCSGSSHSGFYLNEYPVLKDKLMFLKQKDDRKILLLGVSYALLDFSEFCPNGELNDILVMETGGMKGRRKEMVRKELHNILQQKLGVKKILSEYGMTELLSQAYSMDKGIFKSPPWMKILIRQPEDPFGWNQEGKTGGINIIDLANVHSCSFIATQDLGKRYPDGSFEVLGRFDTADIRGCNLMID